MRSGRFGYDKIGVPYTHYFHYLKNTVIMVKTEIQRRNKYYRKSWLYKKDIL